MHPCGHVADERFQIVRVPQVDEVLHEHADKHEQRVECGRHVEQ